MHIVYELDMVIESLQHDWQNYQALEYPDNVRAVVDPATLEKAIGYLQDLQRFQTALSALVPRRTELVYDELRV